MVIGVHSANRADHKAANASSANKMLFSLKRATTILAVSSCRAEEESLRAHPFIRESHSWAKD